VRGPYAQSSDWDTSANDAVGILRADGDAGQKVDLDPSSEVSGLEAIRVLLAATREAEVSIDEEAAVLAHRLQ